MSGADATPNRHGTPRITDDTLEPLDPSRIHCGDVVGIGIHTGNASVVMTSDRALDRPARSSCSAAFTPRCPTNVQHVQEMPPNINTWKQLHLAHESAKKPKNLVAPSAASVASCTFWLSPHGKVGLVLFKGT